MAWKENVKNRIDHESHGKEMVKVPENANSLDPVEDLKKKK